MLQLKENEYKEASKLFDLDVALIKAVELVESNGNGYIFENFLKILFEAHIFHRLTNGKYTKSNLNISSLKWNRSLYKGGAKEYVRLEEAYKLDSQAALKSCSWGLYQIMGFNYQSCGYSDVIDFVNDVKSGLYNCLIQFLNYCKNRNLLLLLRNLQWNKFAEKYNGLGYAINKYHIKLKNAYLKFKKIDLNLFNENAI